MCRHFASDLAVAVLAGYLGGGSFGLIIRRKVGRTVAFTAPRRSDGGRLGLSRAGILAFVRSTPFKRWAAPQTGEIAGRSCCDGIAASAHG